ncbi:MAG: hypothetical protein ACT4PL_04810 [Phycisphaerales bacterium]
MSTKKNPFLRFLVPVVILAGAVGIFFAVARNTGNQSAPGTPGAASPPAGAQPAPSGTGANTTLAQPNGQLKADGNTGQAPPAASAAASAPVVLRVVTWPTDAAVKNFQPLGSTVDDAADGAFRMQVEFSQSGAGIASLKLANHRIGIEAAAPPEVLQQESRKQVPLYQDKVQVAVNEHALVPFALLSVSINGTRVGLFESDAGPSGGNGPGASLRP